MEILNKYIYDPSTDLLGKGGFATVYKAFDKILEMPVALKFFHPQDQSSKYTIINEIRRAIILSHPNIVKYYGVETLVNRNYHGQDEEVQIGVMEFVQEGQLKSYMTANPLNKEDLKKLFIDILEGLKYLHEQGIIHRDIKPQNILLGRDKQNKLIAKIADFGISKNADSQQASASVLLGTIEYMAPEQFNPERYGINKKVGYNVDIWAFGVTAYYLLTGELMFGTRSGDTSAAQLINKIVNIEGLDAKLSMLEEPYKTLLSKCIVPDANIRTNDISELIDILKNPLGVKPIVQAPPPVAGLTGDETQIIDTGAGKKKPAKQVPANDSGETQIIPVQKPSKKPTPKPPASQGGETELIEIPKSPSQQAQFSTTAKRGESGPVVLEEPAQKKSSGLKWVLIIGLIAAVGAGVYYFTTKKGEETTGIDPKKITADSMAAKIAAAMVTINGGDFIMGDNKSSDADNKPEKNVHIKSFKLLETEVTQRMWNDIMGDNKFKESDTSNLDFPAVNVSWNEAKEFVKALNKLKASELIYRLPTEAEWEYAAIQSVSGLNLDNIAWYFNNSSGVYHQVKTKDAGKNGIYDILGNVYEWCEEWLTVSYSDLNYQLDRNQKGRVIRGHCFKGQADKVNTKRRNFQIPELGSNNIGFRLAADF